MIEGKFVVALIPARGGSKGIPRKNIRVVAGKPLIAYPILAAKKSLYVDRIIISTDAPEIAKVAQEWGAEVPFMRPAELAQDSSPMEPVLFHAITELEKSGKRIDVLLMLEATAPLTSTEDMDACIKKLVDEGCDSVITVVEADRNPYFNMVELDEKGRMMIVKKPEKPIPRRQDAPKVYSMTSGAYAIKRDLIINERKIFGKDTRVVVVPKLHAPDIDTEYDLEYVDFLIRKLEGTAGTAGGNLAMTGGKRRPSPKLDRRLKK